MFRCLNVDAQSIDKKIYDLGWEIVDSSSKENLNYLRENTYNIISEEFNINEKNPEIGLNNFHNIVKDLSDTELNQKKVNVIQKISSNKLLVDLIFNSFSSYIEYL